MKQLGDSPISYTFNNAGLTVESAMGKSTLKWEMIQKLWVDTDLVLLFYSQNSYTTLPDYTNPNRNTRLPDHSSKPYG